MRPFYLVASLKLNLLLSYLILNII